MDFREQLAAQKREGEREFAQKQTEAREREAAEAARIKAETDLRKKLEEEKNRRKAEEVFATLPTLVRQAAKSGLQSAVLTDGFVSENKEAGEQSLPVVVEKKTYYLKGWQAPFYDMCREQGVPITVVTEQVESGLKRVLKRTYSILAIDLKHL
jgi:hypothetical protein